TRVRFQSVEILGLPRLEGHDGIKARFATSHAHDLQQRPFVKLVVKLVFVNKEEIRDEREIKLAIAKRQLRQAARHVARSLPRPIIVEKGPIRPFAKSAQELGRLVEIPALSLQIADGLRQLVQIRLAASPYFVSGQIVD